MGYAIDNTAMNAGRVMIICTFRQRVRGLPEWRITMQSGQMKCMKLRITVDKAKELVQGGRNSDRTVKIVLAAALQQKRR